MIYGITAINLAMYLYPTTTDISHSGSRICLREKKGDV